MVAICISRSICHPESVAICIGCTNTPPSSILFTIYLLKFIWLYDYVVLSECRYLTAFLCHRIYKRNLGMGIGSDRSLLRQPGEIIFYESASVTHGRPEPFQGDSFTNIFIHFAPVKGWDVTGNDVEKAAREGAWNKSKKAREAKMENK